MVDQALEITAVNWEDGWPTQAYLNNGETIPITELYDDDGDELFRGDDNVRDRLAWFIAGPTAQGHWITEQYNQSTWEMHRVN